MMKVVILAAGKGTRMLPLTEDIPKVLIEINGKPFLYYVIESLKEAGFTEFGIIVGYKKERVEQFLIDYNIKAELIEQKEQLGTGHAVLQAKEFVGDDDFLIVSGDNLYDVEDLKAMNKEDEFYYIGGYKIVDWQRYGILVEEDGFLKEIKEKPKEFVGMLINTGLYKFKQEIFSLLERLEISPRGEIELTDAVSTLAKEKRVKVIKAKLWLDFGCKEDIPKIEKFLKER